MKTYNLPGPKARKILERDRVVVSPSYPRAVPLVMDRGLGSEVWDVDGHRFVDFAAGIAVNSTGHSHPKVVEAINAQAGKFLHISSDFYHPAWVQLSERLAEIAPFPGQAMVFLGNSGAEAVEAAIKLARHHTGRTQFIGFYGGFHGRTMGALAFTASKPLQRQGFLPVMGGVAHVPFPDPYRPILANDGRDYGETVVRYIEDVVLARAIPPDECAAILVEPIQGEGGYIIPPPGFFPALRQLCDKYGILLIVDEVQSGMGRTGRWWAVENWGVQPDIVCSAKGIASGVPLGAMIAPASLMDWPEGAHGNTYGGNPLACVAALATIDLIKDGLLENAVEQGSHALDALSEIESRHPSVGHVRGLGLMLGLELVRDRATKEPATRLRDRVLEKAFAHGLVMLGCGESAIRLSPALSITRPVLDEGLEILDTAIGEAEAQGLD